jgi:broad specificity phosphatase PhoE
MKIYLTRHSQTYWNKNEIIQTHSNGRGNYLTPEGIEDARKKADTLKKAHIDIGYHSSLYRTKQTIDIILADRNITTIESKSLDDINMGCMDGMTMDEIKAKYPEIYFARKLDKFHYRPPLEGCESGKDCYNRVSPLLDEIVKSNKDTLIVSHKGVSRVILHHLLKETPYALTPSEIMDFPIPNETIYVVDIGLECLTFDLLK